MTNNSSQERPIVLIKNRLFLLATLCLIQISGCSFSSEIKRDSKALDEVEILMQRYFDAFNAADTEAIKMCWHTPGWISNGESNQELKTIEDVGAIYKSLFEKIKSEGWDHSELIDEDIEMINLKLAMVKIHFKRIDKEGNVMMPKVRKGMYKVLKIDNEWKLTTQAILQQ